MQKILNLLGIAQRARMIISGEEIVIKAMQKKQIKLVFVAKDSSDATVDKFQKKCYFYNVELNLDYSFAQLSKAIGKPRKIIGLKDKGIYDTLKKYKEERK